MTDRASRETTLILGGTRSGKSRWATGQALKMLRENPGILQAHLIVTADPSDPRFAERIERHKQERESETFPFARGWIVHESHLDLVDTIIAINRHQQPQLCLVDGLGVWLANALYRNSNVNTETQWNGLCLPLVSAIRNFRHAMILVSTECTMGVHPHTSESRQFVDLIGLLHQTISALAGHCYCIIAGRALRLPIPEHTSPE